MRIARGQFVALLLLVVVAPLMLAFAERAGAQSIWSGLTKTFSKAAFSDHNLPENQDPLTSNVVLTRGSSGGMINIAAEQFFNQSVSPALTEWATDLNNPSETIAAANWENLSFTNWLNAYGGPLTGGTFIAGRDAVVHLIPDDVYLDLRFTSWSAGSGGGYAYLRAEPPATMPTGDYNNNGVVDAADFVVWRATFGESADPAGSGADGDESGTIDTGDYDYWVARFGNISSSAAASQSAVPEPSGVWLVVSAITIGFWRKRRAVLRRRSGGSGGAPCLVEK